MQMETLSSGTILYGRYRVERALGSGGFGHVYLSVDLQTNKQYAIKEYLVTGASGKAQLEHEAQVLSHLHHPNLPALLSAFDENGRYYVVLGYIEGNDLTDYLRVVRQKNEPIPIARLMEWLLSICDAVTFLHSQRPPIIHRDIKPDNIRITPSGTATLVDLGNAKTAADGARTLFFIRHQGTPGYAPLEQYPGGSGTDERSDVYALGGTLYFALTAHEPPSVSTRNQALQQRQPDLPTLQDRLAQNPPDSPQEPRQFRLGVSKPARPAPRHSRHLAQLGTLPPELLRKLDAIIQRAMAMKPKDRYQSVAEFSKDLKAILRALPSSTLPASPNRPIDPHSTQPDLPMLYEALQNQKQAAPAQPTPPAQPVPPTQSAPPAQTRQPQKAGSAVIRCAHCQTELSRQAPYCPHCGKPLNPPNPPQGPTGQPGSGQQRGSKAAPQDISEEVTMLISPHTSPQNPQGQNQSPNASAAQVMPRGGTNPQLATLRAARTQTAKTSTQAPTTARPEQNTPARTLQTQGNSSNQESQVQTRTTVKPFIAAAASTNESAQKSVHSALSAPAGAGRLPEPGARRLFISLAIIVVTLIIVMLLLVVFLRSNRSARFEGPGQYALSIVQNASQGFTCA